MFPHWVPPLTPLKNEIFHPERISTNLSLRRIINDIIGNENLAVIKLHPARITRITFSRAIKINRQNAGLYVISGECQRRLPIRQRGKEILMPPKEAALATLQNLIIEYAAQMAQAQ